MPYDDLGTYVPNTVPGADPNLFNWEEYEQGGTGYQYLSPASNKANIDAVKRGSSEEIGYFKGLGYGKAWVDAEGAITWFEKMEEPVQAKVTLPSSKAELEAMAKTAEAAGGNKSLLSRLTDISLESLSGQPANKSELETVIAERDKVVRTLQEWAKAPAAVGSGHRLFIGASGRDFDNVLNAVNSLQAAGYINVNNREDLADNRVLVAISKLTGLEVNRVQFIMTKLASTGASALIMALTRNFPMAALAYFGIDRALGTMKQSRDFFSGYAAGSPVVDGIEVSQLDGIEIPYGIPNEIFSEYRFVCYDRLTGKWWPSDSIKPLTYDSNSAYRWFCLDRVSGNVYKANLIKEPRIVLE